MTTVETRPFSAADFIESGDWPQLLAARTAEVDRMVTGLADEFCPGAAIVAVGGYGRRELFPFSDVDLLLLFESEAAAKAGRERIAALLQRLWDAGMRVSHSVRTPAECGEIHERNAELNISLLDQRYLAGDPALYGQLAERLGRLLRTRRDDLVRLLARLTAERHARYESTYHHLEPNIKETPGGMRDLQVVRWTARMRQGESELTEEIRTARAFLARTRAWLHRRAGRDDNTLRFEAQEAAAELWAGGDTAGFMRQYYRHARAVYRSARLALDGAGGHPSGLFAQFSEWRGRLSNAEFSVSRERVYLRVPHALEADPDLVLRLFEFVARHGTALSADTAQRVAARLPHLAAHFAEPRALWPAMARIFTLPHAAVALREMHETGVLNALFPELAVIDCLVVRDFYHRYTVDEHSLAAIRALLGLRASTAPADRLYAELLAELERPAVPVFALLFHDVGKGSTEGRHIDGSLAAAESAMLHIGMPEADCRTVRLLIRHHLEMPAAMRSRDLFDPATARYVAGIAGTVEDLKALTLVSWADVSAVCPGAMTAWRAEQLWTLYLAAYNELTRGLDADRIDAARDVTADFLDGFPARYLRTHTAREIEAHLRLEEKSRASGAAAAIERLESAWRLTLVARDRRFLFASIAGTLSGFGMNILKAEAFANRAGSVLDSFAFADPLRTLELNPTEADRLRTAVERAALGVLDVKRLLRNRPKAAPPSRKAAIQPAVSFDNDASHGATLIEVVAQDRPGLLYDLASAMSTEGCNIEVVLVDTEAHKAMDVFYVTAHGGKLDETDCETLAEAVRRACSQT